MKFSRELRKTPRCKMRMANSFIKVNFYLLEKKNLRRVCLLPIKRTMEDTIKTFFLDRIMEVLKKYKALLIFRKKVELLMKNGIHMNMFNIQQLLQEKLNS